jgi:hypothetical protein
LYRPRSLPTSPSIPRRHQRKRPIQPGDVDHAVLGCTIETVISTVNVPLAPIDASFADHQTIGQPVWSVSIEADLLLLVHSMCRTHTKTWTSAGYDSTEHMDCPASQQRPHHFLTCRLSPALPIVSRQSLLRSRDTASNLIVCLELRQHMHLPMRQCGSVDPANTSDCRPAHSMCARAGDATCSAWFIMSSLLSLDTTFIYSTICTGRGSSTCDVSLGPRASNRSSFSPRRTRLTSSLSSVSYSTNASASCEVESSRGVRQQ